MLEGSTILVTGGTGSFGRKFAQIVLRDHKPRKLILFSRDEQKHVDIQRNLFPPDKYPQVRYFVGDVRDANRLKRAIHGVDYVVHAAAMKHVDMAEYNPQECIATNIIGSQNVIDAAIDGGVKKVIAISTDKAANPINLYGATKLCADKLFVAANALATLGGTRFSVVRYGNVIGSTGSVVPLFIRQRRDRLLTVTDLRMTRFWITHGEGAELVLKSFERMQGGEIYVPKIPSMKMIDLAKAIGPECKIKIIGIRPGEKLHECMIPLDDARRTWEFDDHFVIEPAFCWWQRTDNSLFDDGKRCPDGFSYTSDNNPLTLSVEQLAEMVAPFEHEGPDLSRQRYVA